MKESGGKISLLVAGVDEGDSRADDADAVDATAVVVVDLVDVAVVVATVMTCIQELLGLGCHISRTDKDAVARLECGIIHFLRSDT